VNRTPSLFAAIALTAAVTLSLSACGGSDSSKDNGKITGADTGSEESASPSASPSADAARPKITFPSGAENVFEDQETGDATKDAVLADSVLSVNSVDDAIFQDSTDTKALGFYNTGRALSSAITYVNRYIDDNETWTGETRYFDYKVTLSGSDEAYVTYCSDESNSFIKNKKTGKIQKTPTTKDSYVLYNTKLAKNAEGVWQTTDVASTRGHKACQP
jgi:hypothetical protein